MALSYQNGGTQTRRSPWTRLVDMAMTDEEAGYDMPSSMLVDEPHYPPGLCICLTEKELSKLELPDDCEIGDLIDMRCFARVVSVSKRDGPEGASCSVNLQIESLALENEMTEDMPGENEGTE